MESDGEYEISECRKARPELGRALSGNSHSQNKNLLLGKTFTPTIEHL